MGRNVVDARFELSAILWKNALAALHLTG